MEAHEQAPEPEALDGEEDAELKTPDPSARMVTCYGYRCPLRSQCKKGGKCTKTCKTPDDAHWNIFQHLQKSPYHGLEEEEAKELIATVVLEVWEEEEK